VESSLVVKGIPVQVLDTAGIRETVDPVEKMGVLRSRGVAQQADLVLLTIDASSGWTKEDQRLYDEIGDRTVILVINKIDLAPAEQVQYPSSIQSVVRTIAAQQQGIEALEEAIAQAVQQGQLQAANLDLAINQRQAEALTRTNTALQHVVQSIQERMPLDFWSIDLRGAIQALGDITGEDVTESVLDRIFSRFCIGK
jgi:tRNA modification GTPase